MDVEQQEGTHAHTSRTIDRDPFSVRSGRLTEGDQPGKRPRRTAPPHRHAFTGDRGHDERPDAERKRYSPSGGPPRKNPFFAGNDRAPWLQPERRLTGGRSRQGPDGTL